MGVPQSMTSLLEHSDLPPIKLVCAFKKESTLNFFYRDMFFNEIHISKSHVENQNLAFSKTFDHIIPFLKIFLNIKSFL